MSTHILLVAAARRRLQALDASATDLSDAAARYLNPEEHDTFHRLRRRILDQAGRELALLERESIERRRAG